MTTQRNKRLLITIPAGLWDKMLILKQKELHKSYNEIITASLRNYLLKQEAALDKLTPSPALSRQILPPPV